MIYPESGKKVPKRERKAADVTNEYPAGEGAPRRGAVGRRFMGSSRGR